ncbi:uncharacterized protein METZ01_LOCUS242389, partial [marine metagenome]
MLNPMQTKFFCSLQRTVMANKRFLILF